MGLTGMSCLRYLSRSDSQEQITLVDTRTNPPMFESAQAEFPDVEFLCGRLPGRDALKADRFIVSPGIALDSCLLSNPRAEGIPIISDITLFCEAVDAPIIAISGTNGKSTVTELTGALLRQQNLSVGVGGNVGRAALDIIDPRHQAYVLELSSFQLERLHQESFSHSALLNVSSDHMDRYASFEDYLATKHRIFEGCKTAVFNRDDPYTCPRTTVSDRVAVGLGPPGENDWGIREISGIRYLSHAGEAIVDVRELALQGHHNEFNALVALALGNSVSGEFENLLPALKNFSGLPHRCEPIATRCGVRYFNDSKATNVGATNAALLGLGKSGVPSLVLIAGGDAKQSDLEPLRGPISAHVKTLIVLGRDAELIAALAPGDLPVYRVHTLQEAVKTAAKTAHTGDTVLLSPACSSLDMFDNFEARGLAFSAAVEGLSEDD